MIQDVDPEQRTVLMAAVVRKLEQVEVAPNAATTRSLAITAARSVFMSVR